MTWRQYRGLYSWNARVRQWKPYKRIYIGTRVYEVISLPFPRNFPDDSVGCMIRDPGDPTTMVEVSILR